MKDKKTRSVTKAITWRIIGTMDTMLIALLLTGNIKISSAIGGIEIITKTILYYIHERLWNK